MIPYFLLLIIPAFLQRASIEKNISGSYFLRIKKKNSNSLALPAFFVILFMLLALRSDTIGRDLQNYKHYFRIYPTQSLKMILSSWKEVLFRLLNYGIGKMTSEYQWYLVIVAIITVVPTACLYCQNRQHSYLKIVLFVNMSTFIMLFSGLRQSMAIAFGVIAYCAIRDGKTARFLVACAAAILMHTSGFVVALLYPLYHIRLKKRDLLWIAPCMMLIFIFNRQIFGLLTAFVGGVYENYDSEMTATGAYGSLVLFSLFAVFSYVIEDSKKMDQEAYALQNILLMTVAMQCFAPLHALAMRMNYYFIIFIPLAIGKALENQKEGYREVAKLAELVLCVFFTLMFVINTYISYRTGISTLDTIPYVAFWND